MKFEHGVTITVERPGGVDRFNNPLPGATHTVEGCGVAPAGSTERQTDSATVEWDYDLLGPYSADVAAQDVVTIPGDVDADGNLIRYQVDGKPKRLRNPFTGWEAGMVARLVGVEG